MDLKPLSREAIPGAIEKAKHYRLLNEPSAAESIIRDVLRIAPDNQDALVILVLAMTDQFGGGYVVGQREQTVEEILDRITDRYQRVYHAGLVCERRGMAQLRGGAPGGGHNAYEWFREAMARYEEAESLRPPQNDDVILRWNTCARLIERNSLEPRPDIEPQPHRFGE